MDTATAMNSVRAFKRALQARNIRVEKLLVFGSYATNTAKEGSDIDVVVVSPSFSRKGFWDRINILSDAIYEVRAPIEAHAFTPAEWRRGASPIIQFAARGVAVSRRSAEARPELSGMPFHPGTRLCQTGKIARGRGGIPRGAETQARLSGSA